MIFYSFNELTIILPHLLEWGSNTECYKQLIINFGSIYSSTFSMMSSSLQSNASQILMRTSVVTFSPLPSFAIVDELIFAAFCKSALFMFFIY